MTTLQTVYLWFVWEKLVQGIYLPGVRYEEDLLLVVTEGLLIVSRGVDAVLVRRTVRTAVVSAARLWRWIYIQRDAHIMSQPIEERK